MAKQLHSASKINSKSIHMRTCGHKKLLSDRKSSYPKGERARQIFALSNFLLTPLWKTSTWNHLHNKTLFYGTLLVISFPMSQYALCLQLQNPQSETIQGWKILPSRQNHGIFKTAEGRHPMISFSHLKQTGIFQGHLKIIRLSKFLNALLFSRVSEQGHSVNGFTYQRPDYDLCGQCGRRITYFHFLLEFAY